MSNVNVECRYYEDQAKRKLTFDHLLESFTALCASLSALL